MALKPIHLAHLVPSLLSVFLLGPVAGYRHVWQDEVETAERARSILETGLPRVLDSSNNVSLNSGGWEIEDSNVHRYTPWVQFFAGAIGLGVGRQLGFSEDSSVRMPFILAHGLTSTLISYGLSAGFAMSPFITVPIATLFSLQSSRILHNRTARYHSLLDLFFTMGLVGIGMLRSRARFAKVLISLSVILLPHVHTLGGSLLASIVVIMALVQHVCLSRKFDAFDLIKANLYSVVLPAVFSVFALLWLVHPWSQKHWSTVHSDQSFRSLKATLEVGYAFYPFILMCLVLFWQRRMWSLVPLVLVGLYILFAVRVLDFYPFSQMRYYLALPIFFLFWPIAFGGTDLSAVQRKLIAILMLVASITPEFLGLINFGQGVRIVRADYHLQSKGETQPLQQAMKIILEANNRDAVLVDYVPQFVNWYLRNQKPALMPDLALQTPLSMGNEVWTRKIAEPGWHLHYRIVQKGLWVCGANCDYKILNMSPTNERYHIRSGRLGKSFEMCIVKRWPTDSWNNAPFRQYLDSSLAPEGEHFDELILAKRCDQS